MNTEAPSILLRALLGSIIAAALLLSLSVARAVDPTAIEQAMADVDGVAPTRPGDNAKNYDTTIYERLRREDRTLYAQLGGRKTIERFVGLGVDYSVADPRIAHFFADTNLPLLKVLLVEQICQLAGGPCVYEGRSMAEAHAGMGVGENHFIALVEAFQRAMRETGVPFEQENKVLALLAPMKPAVVQP